MWQSGALPKRHVPFSCIPVFYLRSWLDDNSRKISSVSPPVSFDDVQRIWYFKARISYRAQPGPVKKNSDKDTLARDFEPMGKDDF